jgi:TATA-box binding protein (TBP) (component of TFIID and TFIIIB)
MEKATKEYVSNMIRIRDCVKRRMDTTGPVPSYISLTTITSTFMLDTEINIEQIRAFLKRGIRTMRTGDDQGFEWEIKENHFYNQVTAVYVDSYSRKSVKFFPNGRVHVTGCSDLYDCARIRALVELIATTCFDKTVLSSEFMIHMINTNFSMNSNLNLTQVMDVCEQNGCDVSFKPENYSAVKVKFVPLGGAKKVTASIFSSGCILITGATSLKDITTSYAFLIKILSGVRMGPSKVQKTFEIFMGFSFDDEWRKLLALS